MHSLDVLQLPAIPMATLCARMAVRLARDWRQRRLDRATSAALAALDDRTLCDLGFHRSEIGSVAAEIAGSAQADRIRAEAAWRLHP